MEKNQYFKFSAAPTLFSASNVFAKESAKQLLDKERSDAKTVAKETGKGIETAGDYIANTANEEPHTQNQDIIDETPGEENETVYALLNKTDPDCAESYKANNWNPHKMSASCQAAYIAEMEVAAAAETDSSS